MEIYEVKSNYVIVVYMLEILALLQGWLLCVGFVCLANVPDLVRSVM